MEMPSREIPTPFQRRMCWTALTGLALLVIVLLGLGALAGLGTLFVLLEPVLLPLVIAGGLAYLLAPLVEFVQRRVRNRLASVIIVMALAAGALTGIGAIVLPPLVQQTSDLVQKRQQMIESAVDTAHDVLEHNAMARQAVELMRVKALADAKSTGLPESDYESLQTAQTEPQKLAAVLKANSGYLTERLLAWLSAGTHALSGLGMLLIGTVMVPVFLFFFLLESTAIKANWHTLLPLRRSRFREEVVGTLRDINDYIVSFIRGQMLVSVVDGVLLATALKCLGLPYAFTLGVLAALLGIIPYIGMICTWIPALLIAWFSSHDPWMLLWVSTVFLCVSQLDGWVLQPRIVGSRLHMHDMTVMFSVLFWSYVIGGVVGALLAVPLTASLRVLFTRYIWSKHL